MVLASLKIAVVGIGVAGAYLLARLRKEHEVVGFERSTQENHDSICAWGTTKGPMHEFAKKCDLYRYEFPTIHYQTYGPMYLQQNWFDKRHGKELQDTLWHSTKA